MTEHTTPDGANDTTPADESGSDTAAAEALEKDVVFEILKNQRRRRVLRFLRDHGETDLGSLAESIAAEENDTTVEALSADERKRVYIGLYQTHLPKMDDAGVVRYDQSEGLVAAGSAIEQLYPYLETAADDEASDTAAASRPVVDLSGLSAPVTLPAWGLLAALLVVGLLTVAATALPGPLWAGVLAVLAVAATWLVHWG